MVLRKPRQPHGRKAVRKGNPRRSNGHRRNELRRWLKVQGRPCHICGLPIDYGLPPGDPMSFEVDEIIPVSLGGNPLDKLNVGPAHRICNQRRGNRPVSDPRRRGMLPNATSQEW